MNQCDLRLSPLHIGPATEYSVGFSYLLIAHDLPLINLAIFSHISIKMKTIQNSSTSYFFRLSLIEMEKKVSYVGFIMFICSTKTITRMKNNFTFLL